MIALLSNMRINNMVCASVLAIVVGNGLCCRAYRFLPKRLVREGMKSGNEDPVDSVSVHYSYQNDNCGDTYKSMESVDDEFPSGG